MAVDRSSATELIAAGVDVRTAAGRLGHGGGGATTLRVHSAWVSEADQRAAQSLSARLPEPAELSDAPLALRLATATQSRPAHISASPTIFAPPSAAGRYGTAIRCHRRRTPGATGSRS